MRIKQRQVLPGVDKAVSQATKVYVAEACAANDILVATGTKNGFLSVVKASNVDITKCRGPLFVADFAAALGDYVAVALPWKLVTGVNTASNAVGDAVWLGAGSTSLTVPATASLSGGSAAFTAVGFHIRVGRVVESHASTGAYLLQPSTPSVLAGSVKRTGSNSATLTVTGLGTTLAGAPVVALSEGDGTTRHVLYGLVNGSGNLVITLNNADNTDEVSFMIHA